MIKFVQLNFDSVWCAVSFLFGLSFVLWLTDLFGFINKVKIWAINSTLLTYYIVNVVREKN